MIQIMSKSRLIFKNLEAGYHPDRPVLGNVNFSIAAGEYCAVIGSNGSGKSTLLKLVAGLLGPLKGSVQHSFRALAYLPQNGSFNRTFPISVADVLKMSRYVNNDACDATALQNAINTVKLAVSLDCPIQNLSGGQFQRVLFARLLLQNPDLLLLDEPFNGIDEETIHDLADVLSNLHQRGKTILLAIHDWHFVNTFVPTILDVKNSGITLRRNENLGEQHHV
jgi:zinc/manganese transport system ATP-binding protein